MAMKILQMVTDGGHKDILLNWKHTEQKPLWVMWLFLFVHIDFWHGPWIVVFRDYSWFNIVTIIIDELITAPFNEMRNHVWTIFVTPQSATVRTMEKLR